MKIIFLDIDGVLNFKECNSIFDEYYFVDDEKLMILKEIINQTGAKVVLSSDWKIGWIHRDEGIVSPKSKRFIALEEKMNEFGITLFSKTPIGNQDYRGDEIKSWIEQWGGEKIENFVIIDDMDDMRPYKNKLVKTSFLKGGLQYAHMEKAIEILNGGYS